MHVSCMHNWLCKPCGTKRTNIAFMYIVQNNLMYISSTQMHLLELTCLLILVEAIAPYIVYFLFPSSHQTINTVRLFSIYCSSLMCIYSEPGSVVCINGNSTTTLLGATVCWIKKKKKTCNAISSPRICVHFTAIRPHSRGLNISVFIAIQQQRLVHKSMRNFRIVWQYSANIFFFSNA